MQDIDVQIQELESKNVLLEKQMEAMRKTFLAVKQKTIQEFDAQLDKLLQEQQLSYEKEISILTQNLQADDNNIDELQKQLEAYKPRIDKITSKFHYVSQSNNMSAFFIQSPIKAKRPMILLTNCKKSA